MLVTSECVLVEHEHEDQVAVGLLELHQTLPHLLFCALLRSSGSPYARLEPSTGGGVGCHTTQLMLHTHSTGKATTRGGATRAGWRFFLDSDVCGAGVTTTTVPFEGHTAVYAKRRYRAR